MNVFRSCWDTSLFLYIEKSIRSNIFLPTPSPHKGEGHYPLCSIQGSKQFSIENR